jgi:lysophospholipase L1-like esterase
MMRLPAAVALALVAGTVLTACAGGSDVDEPTSGTSVGPRAVYVAVGSDETVGVGADRPTVEAWPQVLYRTALDRRTVFVNAASQGSSMADALDEQLPLALELQPTLVTVWLNRTDFEAGTSVAAFERRFFELVRALRRGGRTEVMVANMPPDAPEDSAEPDPDDIEDLDPTAESDGVADLGADERAARISAYNDAIDRVAAAEGATVVDLHSAVVDAEENDAVDPVLGPDGPSTEDHARIAELFAAAL